MSTVTQNGSVKGFFDFMNERQRIYLAKESGKMPPPYTDDSILQKYFFCNVFREQDKTTVWIRENWRERKAPPDIMIFNMVVARFFNYIPTLKIIGWTIDWPKQRAKDIEEELIDYQKEGQKIFNDAYLIAGTDLKGKNKITGVCERLDDCWKNKSFMPAAINDRRTLEWAWENIQRLPGIGPFIAYEIVTDLRHTPILENAPDIMTWANPGPGAKRGLQRIYSIEAIGNREHQIQMMRRLLEDSPKYTKLKLEMRDIEHVCCEYDKYLRIQDGQGMSRRYRHG